MPFESLAVSAVVAMLLERLSEKHAQISPGWSGPVVPLFGSGPLAPPL